MIGLGPRGWFHLERLKLRDDVVVAAVTDAASELREQARASQWPVVDTPEAVLAKKPLEAVLIASPPDDRAAVITRCLQAGVHVCVEPPLAFDVATARQSLALADRCHKRLSLVPWRRWDANFDLALAAVASSRLGTIHTVRLTVAEWTPLAGPGANLPVMPDLPEVQFGPHGFDQLLQLLPADPTSIWARRLPEEDGFLAVIDFADGSFGQIDFRRRARTGQSSGWSLEGTTGSYRGGRLITLSPDGELIDEPVAAPPASSVSEWKTWCDATRSPARDIETRRMWQTVGLIRAVTWACDRRAPVRWDEIAGS